MPVSKKRRVCIVLCICLVIFSSLALFWTTHVSFYQNFFSGQYGRCISIAFFEKQKMEAVDRIILTAEGKEIIITDMSLIQEIVAETTVATHVNVGCMENRQIDAYCGNQLVRSMAWGTCCDEIKVYEADGAHWLFAPDDMNVKNQGNTGYVYLSKGLANRLNSIITQN